MTGVTQLPSRKLVGVDLQPLAQVGADLSDLAARLGLQPERDTDELGPLTVAAMAVDGTRYLLRDFDEAPTPATELHCADGGDPVCQLRALLGVVDFRDEITHWWDGSVWHEDPLDPAA